MYNTPWNQFPMPSWVGHPEEITGNYYSPGTDNIPGNITIGHPSLSYTPEMTTPPDEGDLSVDSPLNAPSLPTASSQPTATLDTVPFGDGGSPITTPAFDVPIITEEIVDGAGIFDHFMRAIRNQLQREFEEDKIDKSEFMRLYVEQLNPTFQLALNYAQLKVEAQARAIEVAEKQATEAATREKISKEIGLVHANIKKIMQEVAEQELLGPLNRANIVEQTNKIIAEREDIKQKTQEVKATSPLERENLEKDAILKLVNIEKTKQETREIMKTGAEDRSKTREETRLTEANVKLAIASEKEKQLAIKMTNLQMNELKENGASERKLKESQIQVQEQQAALYERQRIGFDDKRKIDTFKAVFDMYAIHATEVNSDVESSAVPALHGLSMSSVIVDILSDVDVGIRKDGSGVGSGAQDNSHIKYYNGNVGYGSGGDQIHN